MQAWLWVRELSTNPARLLMFKCPSGEEGKEKRPASPPRSSHSLFQNPLCAPPPPTSLAPGEPLGLNIQEHSLCTFCKDQAGFQVFQSYSQFTSPAAGDASARLN